MRVYILGLLLVCLLAFGCVQAPKVVSSANVSLQNDSNLDLSNKTPSNNTISYFDPCAYTTNVLSSDECFLNYAKSKSNVSYCERIYMIDRQDECYANFAPLDSNLCSKLVSSQLRSDCYYNHAKLSNNTDLCVKISNTTIKEDCLQELSPPCSFEPDESSTALCLAIYHNSSSFCKSSDQCLFELGVKNKNHASCLQISNSSVALKSACNAVVNNNISLCNESGIDVVADYCYQLSAYATGNYVWCTLAFSGSPYRANCLTHFASIRNEPSICKFSSSEIERDNCYMNYSISTGNYSACDLIKVSLLDSQCRITTALKNADMSACNGLLYSSRTNCFNLVLSGSVPIKSLQSCFDISDEHIDPWEYRCLSDYAHQSKNSSICDLILDSKYNSECKFRFS